MRKRSKLAALGASPLLLALLPIGTASATSPTVNLRVDTTADTVDVDLGDGVCADDAGDCSLRAAIQTANAHDGVTRITLGSGTYDLSLGAPGDDDAASGDLDVSGDVTIRGNRAVLAPVGDRAFDVADGASLELIGLRITGATTPDTESGGAIRSAGTVDLQRVTLDDNHVTGEGASGGAVFNDGGHLSITSSTLDGNTAVRAGGAIEANAGTTEISRSDLTNNVAAGPPGNGGALHLTGEGYVSVFSSMVSGNEAVEGGGLWNSAVGTMHVTSTTLEGNSAVGPDADTGGGALFNDGGHLVVERSTITDNDAVVTSGSGGGIFNNGGVLDVVSTELSGNAAARAGGAIEALAGTTTVTSSKLLSNEAGPMPGNGGALHLTGEGTVTVSRSTVSHNVAASEGGGLWNSAVGTMYVDRTKFEGNSADGEAADNGGGALFNDGGTLVVDRANIVDNTAVTGSGSGGGVFNNAGIVEMTRSKLDGNAAARAGGGIETLEGTVSVSGSTLTDNTAGPMPGNGGALHISGAATVEVHASTVRGNDATNEGGGLWNSAVGTLTVTRSTVTGNTVGVPGNGPNVFQSGEAGDPGVFTIDGDVVEFGPNVR